MIIEQGIVANAASQSINRSLTFPGICILADGRWLCSWRAAPRKQPLAGQMVCLSWSDDCGRTWSAPDRPFIPPRHDGRPGTFRTGYLTELPDRTILAVLAWVEDTGRDLPYFNEANEGLLDTRLFLSRSPDRGQTWSTPEAIEIPDYPMPIPATGPLLVLPDGRLACQFEVNKPYFDETPWRHSSVMAFSSDSGHTWPESVVISQDPANRFFYWDQRPSACYSGKILDVFWTFDRQEAVYRNIHVKLSADFGRAWSPLWDTGVPGQPAAPILIHDRNWCLVYVDRTSSPVIKLRISSDDGRTWPTATEHVVFATDRQSQTQLKKTMQDAWSEMSRFSLGLPATAMTPERDLVVVFYEGPQTDLTSIRWVRINLTDAVYQTINQV
jgi:hypothetical protein